MLVLASKSPRRREILTAAGIEFIIRTADLIEQREPHETPDEYVRRLAQSKASAIKAADDEIVLGADTEVVIDGEVLGKPKDHADAARMLKQLSGREHEVITGICLIGRGRKIVDSARTRVRFVPLKQQEIDDYVRSGEPMDKAGAYAIQGLASKFIDDIDGDYFNIVGLPVALVYRHLKSLEVAAADSTHGS